MPSEQEELERLIDEQRRDDTDTVWPEPGPKVIPLDARLDIGGIPLFIHDFVGVTEDGYVVNFMPQKRGYAMGRSIPHGTTTGYDYHECRCPRCRGAKRDADRVRNEKRKMARTRTIECEQCHEPFTTTDGRKVYCSKTCSRRAYEVNRRARKSK